MKGLAAALLVILLCGAASAGPLELSLGAGPRATSLNDINAAIVFVNTLITLLNDTLAVIPGVSGSVHTLGPMTSGLAFRTAERYWITDWIAFGARFEYASLATSTSGQYQGVETSTIGVALGFRELSVLAGARIQLLDAGLRLAGDIAGGYYFATCTRAVTFEIPSEYPDAISGIPQQGEGRHSGGALGFEAGLSLSYPVADGFFVEALLSYRSATVPELRDASGQPLDLDANGSPESAALDGLSVEVGFSLAINLSLDGEKGE